MTLLAEVLGAMFGGAAVASAIRLRGSRLAERAAGVVLVVVASASLLFFVNVWGLIKSFRSSGNANETISKQAAELDGGGGTNTGFLAWARSQILAGRRLPTFWLTPDGAVNDALTYQWSTYVLLPAREADRIREANWIVFYNTNPASLAYDRAAFRRLIVYAPGFAVAARTK